MSSQPPLSPAEKAAAEALHRHFVETDTLDIQSINPDDFACEARAVVAAVRNEIAAEALADMADRFEAYGTLGGEKAWPFVAEIRMAVQSLSRPTSEETQ